MLKSLMALTLFLSFTNAHARTTYEKILQCGEDVVLDEVLTKWSNGLDRVAYQVVVKKPDAIEYYVNAGVAPGSDKREIVFGGLNRLPDNGGYELFRSVRDREPQDTFIFTEVTHSVHTKEMWVRRLTQLGKVSSYTFKNCRRTR